MTRIAATTLALAAGRPGWSSPISFSSLSLAQGFSYQATRQDAFGIVPTLQIGSTVISSDILCKLPVTKDGTPAKVQAAGVLSSFSWAGGAGDQINLKFNVSTANKAKIAHLLATGANSLTVTFSFAVFTYDPVSRQYFTAITNSPTLTGKLQGLVAKQSGKFELSVANEQGKVVAMPPNWEIQLSVAAPTSAQTIQYQASHGVTATKPWGFSVGH